MHSQYKLLALIKKSGAVREFKDKEISKELTYKIIEAGRWGLSVLGIQPWIFIAIRDKKLLVQISNILIDKSDKMADGPNIILRVTAKIIKNSKLLIAIYNNKLLEKRAKKFGKLYVKRAYIAEIQAIGAAIQNMILQTNELGLGCVWLDAVTFCEKEINDVLKCHDEIVAFLAVGYSAVKASRSKRQENNIIKRFIKK